MGTALRALTLLATAVLAVGVSVPRLTATSGDVAGARTVRGRVAAWGAATRSTDLRPEQWATRTAAGAAHGSAVHRARHTAVAATGTPRRLVIPALGVDNPVVGITAHSGVLLPPSDPQVLGWWTGGAEPGAATGGALITGHTVHTGGGAFDDLATLRPGARVRVVTTQGAVRYAVRRVTVYGKDALARSAARVFSQRVPGRLVLVTCDDWTGTEYLSNAVVVADPLPVA